MSGKGTTSSYCSCLHGAGRKMSRTAAKRTLDAATLVESMKGIAWNNDTTSLIDEVPRAYKDIEEVMSNQADWSRSITHCVRSSTTRACDRARRQPS